MGLIVSSYRIRDVENISFKTSRFFLCELSVNLMRLDLCADFTANLFSSNGKEFSIQVSSSRLLISDVCIEGCFISNSSYRPHILKQQEAEPLAPVEFFTKVDQSHRLRGHIQGPTLIYLFGLAFEISIWRSSPNKRCSISH